MRTKTFFILFVALVTVSTLFAQNLSVKGIIVDKKTGETLIGATILQKGTSNGTITDFNGNFSISIPKESTLTISYLGYIAQEVLVTSASQLKIEMVSNVEALDEVVVVGYGTARKRDLTGSIVSISGESLKSSPDYNPVKALQGKVPGLSMTNSGAAGGSPTIRIRGVATLNAKTDPLFIVDGMFVDNIDFLNPTDISSIEVLKDASSLAIFGIQGANGVIIISTKRAEKGKLMVSYDGYGGVQSLSSRDRLQLTNADDFTMLYNEQLKNMNPAAASWTGDLLGGGTDWQSHIFRPAMITNHGITVSQSNEKASSVFSLGYFKQDGIVKYNSYQRFNGRWAGDYIVSKHFKIGGNATLSRWDVDPTTAGVSNAAQAIPTYSPFSPVEDQVATNLGSYYTPSPGIQKDVANPVAVMELKKGNNQSYGYRAVGNVYAEIAFLKNFTFRATGYGDIGINLGSEYTPRYNVNNATSNSSQMSNSTTFNRHSDEYTKYQADFILNYNKSVGKHRIGAMVGFTARVLETQKFSAAADSLVDGKLWNVDPNYWMLSTGSKLTKTNDDSYEAQAFESYLGRLNYSYADKYLLTATFRTDATSQYTLANRWGYFPSIGLGWIASEESFMDDMKDKINFLKIKASWGKSGNDKFDTYLAYPKIDLKGQQVVVDGKIYYLPTQAYLVDTKLHWEVITGFDAGFESRLLDSRLSIDMGYYNKTTNDLLVKVAPSISVGAGYGITNAGSIRNSGIEYILTWQDKIGKFTYGISTNGATLNNKVLALGTDNSDIVTGAYHRTSVGHSVGAIYGYEQDGIFQNQAEIDSYFPASWTSKPGDIRYKDLDGDLKITDKDRTFIGSSIPTFTYGLNMNAGYENFDFSIEFNGVSGNSIVNTKKLPTYAQFNFYSTALNRWHGEGTSVLEPALNTSRGNNFESSTNLLESGSYFRVRAIQLGYNFPKRTLKALGCNKLRVFVNTQNPITFKNNSGYTPEISGGVLNGGIDDGNTYPLPSVYTAGLSVNF